MRKIVRSSSSVDQGRGGARSTQITVFQRGFTLLEALVALSVLALAFATTLAIQGDLMGSAGANRLRSAAIGLAESKLEELRSLPFFDVAVGTAADVQQIETFTILTANAPIELHRCWTVEERSGLKVISVSVARTNSDCVPYGGSTLVSLRTLLAENDILLAARNANLNPLLDPDGWGRLDRVDPEDFKDVPADDSGFRQIQLADGALAIMSPDGTVLVPSQEGEEQRIATINGNILLSGRSCSFGSGIPVAQACGLRFFTEGNILCEMYVPGGGSELASINGLAAGVDSFHLLAYRCISADQWRRSIALFPIADPEEKVCVGHPGLLRDSEDPNDELKSFVRFYDGRQEERIEFDGEEVVLSTLPHGLAGVDIESDGPAAVIGSVCEGDAPCAADPIVRALVPGGHHFLVMKQSAGTCSARMKEFELIDAATDSLYESLLARNPPMLYCTSQKTYRGGFCLSNTLVSGFIDNQAGLNGREFLIRPLASGFGESCSHAGPFKTSSGVAGNGIFNCAFANNATDAARVFGEPESAFESDIRFDAEGSQAPFLDYALDVVNLELVIDSAPIVE